MSGFLKDKDIGAKRLCSMPDRVTNTINCSSADDDNGGEPGVLYRPTVINCYEKELPTVHAWWEQWKTFMFDTEVRVSTKSGTSACAKRVCQLLDPISRSKYPVGPPLTFLFLFIALL